MAAERSPRPTPGDPDPLLGKVIEGRYRIDARLGSGGMGVVYRARQLKVDRDVAIKLLRRERLSDGDAVGRFLDEAKVISKLSSPHTVTVIDVGEIEDGDFFIAMELLEGRTLRARLGDGALSLDEALRILDPVALSLAEAHAQGIVHRDLKPANVFLARTHGHADFAKVLDFGLAVLAGTRESGLSGTPRYMAPELVGGGDPTPRADVYALGVLFVEMLTGRSPYEAEDAKAMLRAHLEQEPRPLSELAPNLVVPDAVEALVARCLAKPPRLRPKDAGAFRVALRDAAGLVSIDEPPPTSESEGSGPPSVDTKATLPSILTLSRLERPSQASPPPKRWPWALVAVASLAALAWRLKEPSESVAPAGGTTAAASSAPAPAPTPERDDVSAAAPTATTETTRPDMIALLVHTIPDGATVVIDGKRRGETPVTVYLPKDEPAEIRLSRAGYLPEMIPVTVAEDGKLRRVLRRTPGAIPAAKPPAEPAEPSGVKEKMGRYLD